MKEVLPYSDGGSVSRGGGWKKDCAGQLSEIGLLEEGVEEVDLVFGGLTDLELTFRLILLKLQTAGFLLFHPDQSDQPGKMELARACAVDALQLTEKLQSANVSLDQRGLITDSDEMKEIRRQFDMLLSSGGEVLFNAPRSQTKKQKKLIQAVQKALLKHTGPIHGTSETALAQEQAKIEIPEGEEEVNVSDRMILPLSQAILFLEEELLPEIEKKLADLPGDPDLQRQRDSVIDQTNRLQTVKFFPRSRPLLPDASKDLITESLTSFTGHGEPLVSVKLPVVGDSGNTYDHLLEHIKAEIINECAGRGVSSELDAEVKKIRSTSSGKRGGFTEAIDKIDISKSFRSLRFVYPFLRRLENRDELKLLADLAFSGKKADLNLALTGMARTDHNILTAALRPRLHEKKQKNT